MSKSVLKLDSISCQFRTALLVTVASIAIVAVPAQAADLPTGGQIVAGTGSIGQSGSTMTVTQDSANMAANWQSFSIGHGNTVNFVQPSSSAIALNRVLGSDVSVIQGALNANGQIFLINPNGVLFTPSAQVDVGGLVASTLDIKTDDFIAGNYTFEGSSNQTVTNQGSINAAHGGTVALIAAKIINDGSIVADGGAVSMGAGSKVTLDLGGPVKLEVEEGALNTLIEQGGAVRANGGQVFLTAKAAGELATSVINHTGVTEAQTLVTGEKGEIILLGDMQQGTTNVAGKLDASAPDAGDGGFIETSAASVNVAQDSRIAASSQHGKAGTWLIDPYNYTVNGAAATSISGTLSGGTNVTVSTAANVVGYGSGGNAAEIGDITVASAIEKTGGLEATLTLQAANSIIIDAPISSTVDKLNVILDADNNGGARDGGGIVLLREDITTNGGNLDFGTGALLSINGVNTLVGGDVYVGGSSSVDLLTGGGNLNVYGEMLIANPNGLVISTAGGNVDFKNIVNSGNEYTKLNTVNIDWDGANTLAKNGTAGLGTVGDQYLATVTSRLENSVVVYTGGFVAGAGLPDGAWLGGRRVKGIGTDAIWRWVFGPEAAMDGGNGLQFYNQASQTAVNGAFINWLTGEPNGGTGPAGEDRLQIGSDLGRWNDLDNNNIPLDIVIRETNLADSPLTINAGTGAVTFRGAVGTQKTLASLNLSASGGINVNGGYVRTSGVQTYNNDVTLGSSSTTLETTGATTDFTLADNRVIANGTGSAASLILKSARSVIMNTGSSITSAVGALNTTLWSDSDATGGGFSWLKATAGTGATINSNGGSITISGGADTSTGYAQGVNGIMGNGIVLDAATLQSGGGNIILRGQSSTTSTAIASSDAMSSSNTNGIRLHGGNIIDSGTGTISLTGVARGTSGSSNGIETNITGYTKITSASTSATAISLLGDATAGSSSNGWGTFLWGTNTSGIMLAATGAGGGISLNGSGRNVANGGGTHLEPNAFVLAASGPIAITGTKGATSTYEDVVVNGTVGYAAALPAGFGMASPVTASSSNIALTVDTFSANRVFGGGDFTGSAVQSTGTLTIAPRTNGRALSVQTANPGAGPLWIDPTSMFGVSGLFKTGFSKFIFGNGTTGNITLNNYTFDSDTELNTAGTATLGDITIANKALIVNVTGGGVITDTGAVAVSKLKLNGTTSAVTLDSTTNAIGTLAADVASLALINSTALIIGTITGMNGVNATGLVDIATLAGDLTLSQNITTASTANNAVTLNAGKNTAAGTAAGGNIIISGTPVMTTGAGGRATLLTGSVSGSTGLGAFVGVGNSRYNSDETTTNYTTALGAGKYAIYREAPAINVIVSNASKTFDGTPYTTAASTNIDGFVNGDTDAILTGVLAVSGAAQGAVNPGTYAMIPSGLGNGLGYAMNFVPGTLTISLPPPPPIEQVAAMEAAKTIPPLPQTALPSTAGTAPSLGAPATGVMTVGSMEIIPVESSALRTEEQEATGGFDFAQIDDQSGMGGFLKVFVVNGGVNLPSNVQTDNDDDE